MEVSVSGTIDQKTYLKKFRGGFSPLRIRLCSWQKWRGLPTSGGEPDPTIGNTVHVAFLSRVLQLADEVLYLRLK